METGKINGIYATALKDGRFSVTVPGILLDEESQALQKKIAEKWYKGDKFRIKFVYAASETIHDKESVLGTFTNEMLAGGKGLYKRGSGTDVHFADLTLNENGVFHLGMTENGETLFNTDWCPDFKRKKEEQPAAVFTGSTRVVDPESEEAALLMGQTVEISETYVFSEPFPADRVAVLSEINPQSTAPFSGIRPDGTVISGSCVRLHVPTTKPMDLSDKGHRDMIRGRWITHTVTGEEMMIGRFRRGDDGIWKANGKTAEELFKDWRLLDDGSEIGVRI